ncbi:peptidase dimerization domain-containing protein [Brevibacillus laterosporus]|uniref:peptidase dimerization domain-containing protein n=1 Tax=Brevibacillus laterosporus TaxID=1465 RepID=UPI003D1ABAF3
MSGGYQGEGIKTIIPAKATAKITCRIVPNQNPHDLKACIQKHFEANTPPGVNIEIYWDSHSNPYFISPDHPLILQAAQSLEYVKTCTVYSCGRINSSGRNAAQSISNTYYPSWI